MARVGCLSQIVGFGDKEMHLLKKDSDPLKCPALQIKK
jgi:hypothetical protein